MTDLEERDESFDVLMRDAGVRLREHMARSAVPAFHAPRHSSRRRWVIVVATAVVVVVGLVAIGTNRNDQSRGNDPARLRWLVNDLPEGWNPVGAFDPEDQSSDEMPPSLSNLYATDDAPAGPIVLLQGSMGGRPELRITPGEVSGLTNYQETTIAGRRAVLADADGSRVLYIETGGHWVFVETRGIDDAELSRIGSVVVANPDGSASIPPADVPDGLKLVASASAPWDPMLLPRGGLGIAASTYADAQQQRNMTLAVDFARVAVRARDALAYNLKQVTIAGGQGVVGSYEVNSAPPITSRMVYWERDGVAFRLTGLGVSESELLAAAASVAPASSSQWAALLQRSPGVAPAETVAVGTSPADEAPPGTDPPFTGEAQDVAIDVSVAAPSVNEQLWSGAFPDGETWQVQVVRLYDTITMRPAINGLSTGSMSGSMSRPEGQQIGCCNPVNVITANPKASALRVMRHNGERYTIPLRDLPGTNGLRIALLAVPEGGPQAAELIDADGNVLEKSPVGG